MPVTSSTSLYRQIQAQIPHLRRYALALARNSVAADDLVQECLLRAMTKHHLFKPGTNLRAWLFTILHNLHVSEVRRQSHAGPLVDPQDMGPAVTVAPAQDEALLLRALRKAMLLLPECQRDALQLVALDGLSYEEASSVTGVAIGTLKSRISRARSTLRAQINGQVAYPNVGHDTRRPHRRNSATPSFGVRAPARTERQTATVG